MLEGVHIVLTFSDSNLEIPCKSEDAHLHDNKFYV